MKRLAAAQPDAGLLIGMSIALPRLDLEAAVLELASLGFQGMEIHIAQLGPGFVDVNAQESHAAAAGDVIRRSGLVVSTFNVVGHESFAPYAGAGAWRSTSDALALHLRMAAAMGAPRVLIWEGRVEDRSAADTAPAALAACISRAQERSGLPQPPEVSVECHPYTFALRHGMLAELAAALRTVGAGICLDFCHFGIGVGRDVSRALDPDIVASINHVHYADTDGATCDLHLPPGEGIVDIDRIGHVLAGRRLAISWDLFSWPGPRAAMRRYMDRYRSFVEAHAAADAP